MEGKAALRDYSSHFSLFPALSIVKSCHKVITLLL